VKRETPKQVIFYHTKGPPYPLAELLRNRGTTEAEKRMQRVAKALILAELDTRVRTVITRGSLMDA
jgi:hypothetical protein